MKGATHKVGHADFRRPCSGLATAATGRSVKMVPFWQVYSRRLGRLAREGATGASVRLAGPDTRMSLRPRQATRAQAASTRLIRGREGGRSKVAGSFVC